MSDIFAKSRLAPGQLRTVADRRFDDAIALRDTRQNARANGAMYLGGFVLECLLKATLLERHPWLQRVRTPQGRSRADQRLWSLCYRLHELDEILGHLPDILTRIQKLEQRDSQRLTQSLRSLCSQWSIHARYSPHTTDMTEARLFLEKVKELKPWLR